MSILIELKHYILTGLAHTYLLSSILFEQERITVLIVIRTTVIYVLACYIVSSKVADSFRKYYFLVESETYYGYKVFYFMQLLCV